ncbi:MAG TPA: nucleoside hydrolase [Acidimicrobiales bacterium]|nr:nucleoside hydrolase [Acidimicrobiales bacterium]
MTRILLDCDPGHDDAIALLLAAGSPAVELAGITTVAGNQTLDKTTRNALSVAAIAGVGGVPVVAGCDRPLLRPLRTAASYHGESGLDGPDPVAPAAPARPGHAVDFLVESILASPGEITLVATGPLTNVALAVRKEPEIAAAVREVVVMGGSCGRGNVTPAAEFNIYVDPEAAAIVLGAPWDLTLLGLDLTHQALCTTDSQRAIAALGTAPAHFVDQLLTFFRGAYRRHAGMDDPPLHDACAVGYVAAPELFTTRPASIEVELCGRHSSGMTVVDFGDPPASPARRVAVSLDVPVFFDLLLDAIARLGRGASRHGGGAAGEDGGADPDVEGEPAMRRPR